jgi:hypothetical protein
LIWPTGFNANAFEASYDPEWDNDGESQCKVWIDTRRTPPPGAPLQVILGQEMIGTLAGEDTRTLERDLRKAQKRKQPLILEATIERVRCSIEKKPGCRRDPSPGCPNVTGVVSGEKLVERRQVLLVDDLLERWTRSLF